MAWQDGNNEIDDHTINAMFDIKNSQERVSGQAIILSLCAESPTTVVLGRSISMRTGAK